MGQVIPATSGANLTAACGCVPCGLLEEAGGHNATGGHAMDRALDEVARRVSFGPGGKREGSVRGVSKTG